MKRNIKLVALLLAVPALGPHAHAQTLGDQLALDRKIELARRCAEADKLGMKEQICASVGAANTAGAPAADIPVTPAGKASRAAAVAEVAKPKALGADDVTIYVYKRDDAGSFIEAAVNGQISRMSIGQSFQGLKLVSLNDYQARFKGQSSEFDISFRVVPPPAPASPAVGSLGGAMPGTTGPLPGTYPGGVGLPVNSALTTAR